MIPIQAVGGQQAVSHRVLTSRGTRPIAIDLCEGVLGEYGAIGAGHFQPMTDVGRHFTGREPAKVEAQPDALGE